ncbi:MAG: hypothetical protein HFI19_10540 [Lachnospiraceae bacterium]|nr:hypothetical protein [Lachnospiraceae bacterium]
MREWEWIFWKPVSAGANVIGKLAGGFTVCLIALGILNVVFYAACRICTRGNGFEVHFRDFLAADCLYILPNMLMIVCIYSLISIWFKNPLPALPHLILHMVYSNMGSRNAEGVFGYYGRPLGDYGPVSGAVF